MINTRVIMGTVAGMLTLALGGVMIYSLLPYIQIVGLLSLTIVLVLGVYGSRIFIAYSKESLTRFHHHANTIAHGDVVAYYDNGNLIHLSASQPTKVEEIPEQAESTIPQSLSQTVVNLHKQGMSIRDIAETIGLTTYRTRKIILQSENEPTEARD